MPALLRYLLRLGPLNPIAVRLVQGGSRRSRHMYIRSLTLGGMILTLLWLLLVNTDSGASGGAPEYRDLAAAGAGSFAMIAYLQIGLICIIAPVFMAGAIAQEASPRTWEVLLTTPMTPGQIVLGNLSGRLFFVLSLLLSSLPLFALTQYFGGVPGRSIFVAYLVAASAAILVGSIAIALSCSRVVGRRAVFAFYVTVISYLAITLGIDRWLVQAGFGAGERGDGVTWMTGLNPFLALYAMLTPTGYPRADIADPALGSLSRWMLATPVTAWVVGSLTLSLVMVVASALTVRLGGLGTIAGTGAGGSPVRRWLKLGAKDADHRPPREVWANPVAWREAAARNSTLGRILTRWSFILFGALWGIGLVIAYHRGGMTPDSYRLALATTVLGELAVTTLVAINMSATAISREREDGTLDLLLTTPLTASAYLSGKRRGLIAYLLPLVLVPIGTLGVAGIAAGLGQTQGWTSAMVTETVLQNRVDVPIVLPEAIAVAALVCIAFLAFCVMIGLQWSLKSKGTLGSVVASVGVIGAIGGTIGLCGVLGGRDIPAVGPALAALSPASTARALIDPVGSFFGTVSDGGGLPTARLALGIGAVASAGIYIAIIYGLHSAMVRNFDFTVRKLAGMK
ncbi:MAG: ABC transporter permease subunit [Planctomycetota bacterium]